MENGKKNLNLEWAHTHARTERERERERERGRERQKEREMRVRKKFCEKFATFLDARETKGMMMYGKSRKVKIPDMKREDRGAEGLREK